MKVAIAGIGDVARYLIEELPKEGHEIVALTRSHKPFLDELGVAQRVTDYADPSSVAQALNDCDAVVSTITFTPESRGYVEAHLAILSACKASPKCKRFIPSCWAGNVRDVTDQPVIGSGMLEELVAALRAQSEVRWTLVNQGWFSDYLVPRSQRHLKDIGDIWVQDHEKKIFTIYGLGGNRSEFTAARDVMRAVGRLLHHDAAEWEEYTFVSGEQTSWRGLWEFVKARDPAYTLRAKTLSQSIRQLLDDPHGHSGAKATYDIMAYSESLALPAEEVRAHREKYFKGLRFRTLAEIVDEAAANPGRII